MAKCFSRFRFAELFPSARFKTTLDAALLD
jgi:hypothetical protein